MILGHVIKKCCLICFVVSHHLPVGLWVLRGCCRQLGAEVNAKRCKTFASALSTTVFQHIFKYPVRVDPVVKKYVRRISGRNLVVGISLVSLEYLSIITTTYWFLWPVLGKGPKIFIATNSNGPVAGNN